MFELASAHTGPRFSLNRDRELVLRDGPLFCHSTLIDATLTPSVPCRVQTKSIESSRLRVADDITDLVGETPILHLRRIAPPSSAAIYAKLEYLNPGGSVKDRAAIGIIRRAEDEGLLKPGGTIVEATAGNTGIGLALIGMRALGAEVIRTPDADGMAGAITKAKELAARDPKAFMAAQFENPSNPDYHYETTAREIFDQMEGRIDALVIGVGTSGTFTGLARYLKERLPHVQAYAVETQGSILGGGKPGKHKVEGIGSSFIPKNFDPAVCDEVIMVTDPDAFGMVKDLASVEGVLSGSSGGANVFAAVQVAQRLDPGKRVVTMIADSAERYLSKKIFEGGI